MTSLQRLAAELLAGVALCAAFWGLWVSHNHTEQGIGAQACVQSTTETRAEVVTANQTDVALAAGQLQLVVKTYDDHVADLARSNADLARRLHDSSVRQSAAPGSGSAAGQVCTVDVPAGQSGARDAARIEQATVRVFTDCDADHEALIGVTAAYNDWRARMLAAQTP